VPFGGLTVVFGGDFRQTLPIVPGGTRGHIVGASLIRSYLWRDIRVHYLRQNMRLERVEGSAEHAQWLVRIGGRQTELAVEIPRRMCVPTLEDLITSIYPQIGAGQKQDEWFLNRTILCAKNDDVNEINQTILDKFPGDQHLLFSTDSVVTNEDALPNQYPVEYLQSLNSGGLPLSKLRLKVGCPLMLLRNLDPSIGLCNGTRMVLLRVARKVLYCRIISGDAKYAGNGVMIPRIILAPSSKDIPIPLQRRQFPVRLAFAMTINKSQGQSVQNVGINLTTPVFSHGQLYVALSRCTSGDRIKVLLDEERQERRRTLNVVYEEVFTQVNV
jgi:hypothetical protein